VNPRFQGENFQRNLALVDRVAGIAKARGITPAQLALAWLSLKARTSSDPRHAEQSAPRWNAAAADIVLTSMSVALAEALPQAIGMRYPEASMRAVNL
jgi:aryl-alcohol dehydrogenase-like predicted oxidoreductase